MRQHGLRDERAGACTSPWLAVVVAGVLAALPAAAQTQRPAAAAAVAGASVPIPLEDFIRDDQFEGIKISPDGEFVAMVVRTPEGHSALMFLNLADRKVSAGGKLPDDLELTAFYWVSPTTVIYTVSERHSSRAAPYSTGEIFAMDRDGRGQRQIYGFRAGKIRHNSRVTKGESSYASARVVDTLDDDDEHILIAEYSWRMAGTGWLVDWAAKPLLSRLNVVNGRKQELGVSPLHRPSLLVDRQGEIRFAAGYNEQGRYAVSWRPQAGASWQEFELPGFREDSVAPELFAADNRSIYFRAIREGESTRKLFRLDLEDKAVALVYGSDDVDVDGVVLDFEGRDLIGVHAPTAAGEHHWLDKDHPAARLRQSLAAAFPGQSVELMTTSKDGRRAIACVTSDVNPGEYYLFDAAKKTADMLGATHRWLDPAKMQPKQSIEVQARDGLRLQGYLTRPAVGAAPYPLILLPHSGPYESRDYDDFDHEAQLFASRGYAVLQVNYRGSTGYGKDFLEAGYRQWGSRMQDDLSDATRWAVTQGIAAAERICIYGWGYGGYAALMGLVREPGLYRCAVGMAGFYDLELLRYPVEGSRSKLYETYLDRAHGSDRVDLKARSPVTHAAKFEDPVLLVHGGEDEIADVRHYERMRAALAKEGKPAEVVLLEREGHGLYDEKTRIEVYRRVLAFFDKHMQPGATAAL